MVPYIIRGRSGVVFLDDANPLTILGGRREDSLEISIVSTAANRRGRPSRTNSRDSTTLAVLVLQLV